MPETTTVFQSGNNQAVRWPKDFRCTGRTVASLQCPPLTQDVAVEHGDVLAKDMAPC